MERLSDIKVFVVDDDPFYLNIFSQYLYNFGIEDISLFENGWDALEQLKEQPVVVFLDKNMDDISGYEVLKEIKRHDPSIYVIMITAQEDVKAIVDSLKLGALDYIQKGNGEVERVKKILNRIVEIRAALVESTPNFLRRMFQFS